MSTSAANEDVAAVGWLAEGSLISAFSLQARIFRRDSHQGLTHQAVLDINPTASKESTRQAALHNSYNHLPVIILPVVSHPSAALLLCEELEQHPRLAGRGKTQNKLLKM
eukprot:scaffold87943_cov13-Tisochrysis_lutea.AAC.1